MTDRIELRGLRALGTHGVLPEEKERAQPFEVDLDVELDLRPAGVSDRLEETVDYGALAEAVTAVIVNESHALIEKLAERIAEIVLADPKVSTVSVTVRKLRPPVPVSLDTAAVSISRER